MHQYAAVLGHQPHISIAELACSVPDFELLQYLDKRIAIFASSADLDSTSLTSLGGSIVIAKQIETSSTTVADVPKILAKEIGSTRGKIVFGLRCHGVNPATIKKLYRQGKDAIKALGKNCRYVGNERKAAVPVLLHDSGLITGKHGCELFLIEHGNALWIGRTIAAQDVDSYTKRDIEKPVRDTTVGLLPPKLAQIMLNMGAWMVESTKPTDEKKPVKKKKKPVYTVFDPFCGTGVIPIECLLLGWHVLASDVSQKAVNGCTKNLDWLRKEEKILKKDVSSTIWKHNATKPFDLKELPDMVVTETSLGPNLTKKPTAKDAKKLMKENEELQNGFLESAAASMPGVPIVCSWPTWQTSNNETVYLEKIWDIIGKHGYRAVLPPGIEPTDPKRITLHYRRKEQFVGRELVMLEHTGQ